jgi:ubiquinone/menaquinone biosynthesis C-methylase UbiE
MSGQDRNFSGSIPEIYDDVLVPMIFEHYAKDMAQRVASTAPKAVLETAAGSGAVARALAPLLSKDARYVVTDLNPPMLERAQRRQPADERIEWRQADAAALPFDDHEFDVVCCQFGMMFLPDKPLGYREALRLLREDGRFIFNVWDRIEENEFAQCVTATAARFFPNDPPKFLARTPHGFFEVETISRDLKKAGFDHVDVTTITAESRAESPHITAFAFCQGTPLRKELEERDASRLDEITTAAAADLEQVFGAGPVCGKMQAHVIVASR